MQRHGRFVEGACDRLVGLRVVLGLELGFWPLPECARRIDLPRLAFFRDQFDRELDIIGVGPDDALDFVGLQVLGRVRLQMQDDFRSPRGELRAILAGGRDFKTGAARRRPGPNLIGPRPATGHDNAVGDHESGIKADTELSNQAGPILRLLETRNEGFGPGTRDGTEIVDQFLPVHTDAGIGNRQRVFFLVRDDPDFRQFAVTDQRRIGDRLIAQLVACVGSVRDQLAQENVGLRIDRMDHEVQKLGNLGLKWLCLNGGINRRHFMFSPGTKRVDIAGRV